MPLGIGIGLSAVLLASAAGGTPVPAYSGDFTGATPTGFTQSRASSATYSLISGARQTAGTDAPRPDYDPTTAVTNLWPYSNSFASTRWTGNAGTLTDAVGAFGTTGRSYGSFMETTGNTSHTLYSNTAANAFTASSGQTYTAQFKVMPIGGTTTLQIGFGSAAWTDSNGRVNFDLAANSGAGAVTGFGGSGITGGTITKLTGDFAGFYLITATGTANATAANAVIGVVGTASSNPGSRNPSYVGNPANGFYVGDAQVRLGTTAGEFVPTNGAAASVATYRGHLLERQSTNYVLNSGAPATQDVTLPTGTFTLWVEGTGSCTAAASTAVGSGFGAATAGAGNHNTFTVTTAGTVTLTVSGAVTIFQCESYPVPSSYIPTTGATVTRAADTLSAVPSAVGLSNPLVGAIVAQGSAGWTSAAGAQSFFSLEADTNNRFQVRRQGGNYAYRVRANSTDIFNGATAVAWPLNASVKVGLAWGFGVQAISANGATLATNTVAAISGFNPTALVIGSGNSDASFQGSIWWIRKIDIYASQLTEAQLNAATT